MGKLKVNFQLRVVLCLLRSTYWQLLPVALATPILFASCAPAEKDPTLPKANLQKIIDSAKQIPNVHNRVAGQAALDYINQAFNKVKDNATPVDLNNYYTFKFIIEHRDLGNDDKALRLADSMILNIAANHLEHVMAKEYSNALYAKGDALFGKGEYDNAYTYFVKGRTVGQLHMSTCELSDYSFHIGLLLYKQERYKDAASYFAQSFTEAASCDQKFDEFYRRQEVLNNEGLSYDEAGMPDSALTIFTQALNYIQANDGKYPEKKKELFETARAVIYGNIANVYIKEGKYLLADSLLQLSININTKPGNDVTDAIYSYLKQAKLYFKTGDHDKMSAALKTTKKLLDSIPNASALQDWCQLTSNYYQSVGKSDSALQYLNAHLDLKKQREQDLKDMQETDYVERMKMLDNQNQITSLQKQNSFKEVFLVVAALLGIMFIFIICLVYRNGQRSKRYIRSLTNLNNKIREHRNEMKITMAQLENHNKEKDRMLRVVAHDLRTPIAGISSITEVMLNSDDLTQDQLENLKLISASANTSLALSEEILEATSGFTPDKWLITKTDIRTTLNSHAELLKLRAKEKEQTFVLSLPPTPVLVAINPEKMGRAITNIMINAIKFSPAKSKITLALKEEKNKIIFTIKDEGIGIPDIMKEKIFDMFTEAKRYGTAGEKPFGLGLSIAKQIIEAHSGTIEFESSEGQGSTFKISLPV